jgi:hypothetical protein
MKGFAVKRAGPEGFAAVSQSDAAAGRHQASGASMSIRSFTADRMRCLQARHRSVVWIETCTRVNISVPLVGHPEAIHMSVSSPTHGSASGGLADGPSPNVRNRARLGNAGHPDE